MRNYARKLPDAEILELRRQLKAEQEVGNKIYIARAARKLREALAHPSRLVFFDDGKFEPKAPKRFECWAVWHEIPRRKSLRIIGEDQDAYELRQLEVSEFSRDAEKLRVKMSVSMPDDVDDPLSDSDRVWINDRSKER